jgi:hypothetical protein
MFFRMSPRKTTMPCIPRLSGAQIFSVSPLSHSNVLGATFGEQPSLQNCYPIGSVPESDSMATFVKKWVLDIVRSIHYVPDIELCAIDDYNLFADLSRPRRRIAYGKALIGPMMSSPRTNWEAIAILSHEIGHVVLHHSPDKEASFDVKRAELEADEFAGYILAKLGVDPETVEIFRKYGDFNTNHPLHHGTPDERRNAARTGYRKAKIDLAYDARFIPYLHDAKYLLLRSSEGFGLLGGIAGSLVAGYALFVGIARRVRYRRLARLKAFISYRRDDSAGETGRIFDHLKTAIPERQIFMDVDSIQAGADFNETIEKAVAACDVLLAVVGKRWLSAQDAKGARRLDDAKDLVRTEIGAALRAKIRVIPILVNGAAMPERSQLPLDLQTFALCNALEIRHNRFNADVQHLIASLGKGK